MSSSKFPHFQGVENVFDAEALASFQHSNPQQTQPQPQTLIHQQNQVESPDRHAMPCLQSSINQRKFITDDPVQIQIQAQIAAQAQLRSEELHQEQPLPQSDLQRQIQHAQSQIHALQSHVNVLRFQINAQPPQTQSRPVHKQTSSELQLELQRDLSRHPGEVEHRAGIQMNANSLPWSQYPPTKARRPQTFTEKKPALTPVFGGSHPTQDSLTLEPKNAQMIDLTVDEIQSNIASKNLNGQKPSHRRQTLFRDKNPFKPRRVSKNCKKTKNCNAQHAFNNGLAQSGQHVEQTTDPLSVLQHNLRNSSAPLGAGSASNLRYSNALRNARSEPKVRCLRCDSMFADPQAMRRHFFMSHVTLNTKNKVCRECLLVCKSEAQLIDHWNRSHVGELDFACDACGARFSKNRNRSIHQTKFHRNTATNSNLHKCKLCGFTSEQKLDVVVHFFRTHADETTVECPGGCGRTFESIWHAKIHFFNCTHISPCR